MNTCIKKIGFLSVLLLLFLSPSILAQEEIISVSSSVDKATITIGDPITYTLSIIRQEGVEVRQPALGENLGQFEIRDYRRIDEERLDDGRILDQTEYIITTYATGEYEIPPVEVTYTDLQGQEKTISSEAIQIVVESVKPSDAQDIKGIKGPVLMRADMRPYYRWGGFVLGILVAGAAFLYWRRRLRRVGGSIAYEGPPRPAHEIAYEELRRIAQLNLIQRGLLKQFYTEVSEAIRRYVGRRYEIATMELTTGELVEAMSEVEVEEDHLGKFHAFLEDCDLVKFAKHIPPREEIDAVIDRARELVDLTKEQEPVEEDAVKPAEADAEEQTELTTVEMRR